jgi:hypothetical protein
LTSLGGAIIQVTKERGEEREFTVMIPEGEPPLYVFDDDSDNPVEVPADIVEEAEVIVAENPPP